MTTPVEILLHDEVQLIDWGESRTRGPTVTFRLSDPELLAVFRGMDTATAKRSGHVLHITIASGDIVPAPEPEEEEPALFGQESSLLRRSGYFRAPAVWREIGSDDDFLDWLTRQPCAVRKLKDSNCEGAVVPAHVRRVASGAGTSKKPEYSAVPLCDHHHRLQHQHGEIAVGGREFFDAERIRHVEQWAWETLKHQLGYAHWNQVPPEVLLVWAESNGTEILLPRVYAEARCHQEPAT